MSMNSLSRSHTSPFRRREILEGYLLLHPFSLAFWSLLPFQMGWALVLNFQKYNLLAPPRWVGMANMEALWADPKVSLSLWNTAVYAFTSVPLQLALAFGCAVLLNQPIRGRNFYRTALYMPVIVPIVVSAFIWQRAYHPDFGIINAIIGWVGLAPVPGSLSRRWPNRPLSLCASG
ncbi:MAG: sugar ABC transporter permease [Caldilineaceae bacterium]